MALVQFTAPLLPTPPSWFPGHMMKFTRMLPSLLTRTDVVLEIRDSRMPLTSINRTLEGTLRKWRAERGWSPHSPGLRVSADTPCERLVVYNKSDLVPEWGLEPFKKAMSKRFPGQHFMFASLHKPRHIRDISHFLLQLGRRFPHNTELNVLVIGMPNVGKSTLLNALRNIGIQGPTPKAFQTSAQPGLTQALSTRLKLSVDPLVYAFDSPGVMLPYLGHGSEGAERGVKLALIAGIKEGLYDMETLASYLLYRLNVLDPISPSYLPLLPSSSPPTTSLNEFLNLLAKRMGMLRKGEDPDLSRAAAYFIRWWREGGSATTNALPNLLPGPVGNSHPPLAVNQGLNSSLFGWGFDLEWPIHANDHEKTRTPSSTAWIEERMGDCIDDYITKAEMQDRDENNLSATQKKKRSVEEVKRRRKEKWAEKHRMAKS